MNIKVGRFVGYIPDGDPADILAVFLAKAIETQFKGSESALHDFFYRKKQLPEFQELLKDLHFSTSSYLPYSSGLSMAIHDLKSSGFLTNPNPTYSIFQVKGSNHLIPEHLKRHESLIDKLATDFKSEFSNGI